MQSYDAGYARHPPPSAYASVTTTPQAAAPAAVVPAVVPAPAQAVPNETETVLAAELARLQEETQGYEAELQQVLVDTEKAAALVEDIKQRTLALQAERDASEVHAETARRVAEGKRAAAQALQEISRAGRALWEQAAHPQLAAPEAVEEDDMRSLHATFDTMLGNARQKRTQPFAATAMTESFVVDMEAARGVGHPTEEVLSPEMVERYFGRVVQDERSAALKVRDLQELRCTWRAWAPMKVATGRPEVRCEGVPLLRRAEMLRQLEGDSQHCRATVARVLLLVADEDETLHPFERLKVLVAKYQNNGTTHYHAYGGCVDDSNASEDAPGAALRILRELTGTDLSSTALRPFFEADVCEGEEQVVHRYYVADYSACGPRVLSFAGAQRASVGLQATPCLVSVRELLHGLEGCEDVLRLAGEALRVLLVEKAAAQMLRYLEAASRGGRFPSKKKRRKIETQGGQAMVVTETLAAACGTPLALLDALQHPTLAPSGTLPRRVVARYLLCADPTLDNEALHALLTPLGLHHAEETRYNESLTQCEVFHVLPGNMGEANASTAKASSSADMSAVAPPRIVQGVRPKVVASTPVKKQKTAAPVTSVPPPPPLEL